MTPPVSAYKYVYLIFLFLSHPAKISLEWMMSFPWPDSSICHHILIPYFCKIEFPMKPFDFFLTSESREDSIRNCHQLFPYLLLNDDPWSLWFHSINVVISEVSRSHFFHSLVLFWTSSYDKWSFHSSIMMQFLEWCINVQFFLTYYFTIERNILKGRWSQSLYRYFTSSFLDVFELGSSLSSMTWAYSFFLLSFPDLGLLGSRDLADW